MAESEGYRDGDLAVTAQAVEVGNRSWALANVARAYAKGSATGCSGWAMAVVGVLIVIALAVSGGETAACYTVGGVLALIGIVVALAGMGAQDVMLELAGGKRVRAWSGPRDRAEVFVEAINAAVGGK